MDLHTPWLGLEAVWNIVVEVRPKVIATQGSLNEEPYSPQMRQDTIRNHIDPISNKD
jgi:hypothetical protein